MSATRLCSGTVETWERSHDGQLVDGRPVFVFARQIGGDVRMVSFINSFLKTNLRVRTRSFAHVRQSHRMHARERELVRHIVASSITEPTSLKVVEEEGLFGAGADTVNALLSVEPSAHLLCAQLLSGLRAVVDSGAAHSAITHSAFKRVGGNRQPTRHTFTTSAYVFEELVEPMLLGANTMVELGLNVHAADMASLGVVSSCLCYLPPPYLWSVDTAVTFHRVRSGHWPTPSTHPNSGPDGSHNVHSTDCSDTGYNAERHAAHNQRVRAFHEKWDADYEELPYADWRRLYERARQRRRLLHQQLSDDYFQTGAGTLAESYAEVAFDAFFACAESTAPLNHPSPGTQLPRRAAAAAAAVHKFLGITDASLD
eukprot:6185802-Pleurochrysis_carterae.AAC.1